MPIAARQLGRKQTSSVTWGNAGATLASVQTLDAFVAEMGGAGALDSSVPTKTTAEKQPEKKLVYRILMDAIKDSRRPVDDHRRRDSRAWLRDAAAIFSARYCFESIGAEYDAVREALEREWAAADSNRKAVPA